MEIFTPCVGEQDQVFHKGCMNFNSNSFIDADDSVGVPRIENSTNVIMFVVPGVCWGGAHQSNKGPFSRGTTPVYCGFKRDWIEGSTIVIMFVFLGCLGVGCNSPIKDPCPGGPLLYILHSQGIG